MSDRVHIIEIDRIVLTGAAQCPSDRLHSLVEAEVQCVLSGVGIPKWVTILKNSETSVAGEVANFVAQAVHGGDR